MFYSNMTILRAQHTHISIYDGIARMESGQSNNEKWDELKALINAKLALAFALTRIPSITLIICTYIDVYTHEAHNKSNTHPKLQNDRLISVSNKIITRKCLQKEIAARFIYNMCFVLCECHWQFCQLIIIWAIVCFSCVCVCVLLLLVLLLL